MWQMQFPALQEYSLVVDRRKLLRLTIDRHQQIEFPCKAQSTCWIIFPTISRYGVQVSWHRDIGVSTPDRLPFKLPQCFLLPNVMNPYAEPTPHFPPLPFATPLASLSPRSPPFAALFPPAPSSSSLLSPPRLYLGSPSPGGLLAAKSSSSLSSKSAASTSLLMPLSCINRASLPPKTPKP